MRRLLSVILTLAVALVGGACSTAADVVVIYTSVDQPFSEPVLRQFEEETGIDVRAVYDTEATKTTGLVSRLIAERDRPQADVFWSSEIAQTMLLVDQGIIDSYASPAAVDIPPAFVDAEQRWTGVGYRARVLLVNTDLVEPDDFPSSIFDLADAGTGGSDIALANPLFGTTATHAAVLYASLGPAAAEEYYQAIADNGVRIVDGNSVVRDMVADGEILFGMTDTDDALIAVNAGDPVEIIFPDQGGIGTLLIPNTVALIDGAPNRSNAQTLIDYLVSRTAEQSLIDAGFLFGSLRDIERERIEAMEVDWGSAAQQAESAKQGVQAILLR